MAAGRPHCATAYRPGLGELNIGAPAAPTPLGIDLLADGISHTVNPSLDPFMVTFGSVDPRLELTQSLSPATTGWHIATQCVVADPTMMPFGLDLTQCADITVESGVAFPVNTGVDGSIRISLPPGMSFPFHDASYTEFWVNADGFVNFGGPSTIATPSVALNTAAFVTGRPAIAVWWADFAPTLGQVTCTIHGNRARITWGASIIQIGASPAIAHTGGSDANTFSLELELARGAANSTAVPGRFTLIYDALDSTEGAHYGYGVLGHTPGGPTAQFFANDSDLHGLNVSAIGSPVFEEHAVRSATGTLGFDGTGQRRHYNDMRSWNGQSITFSLFPQGTTTPTVYFISRIGHPTSDVISRSGNTVTLGTIQTLTIAGKFRRFDLSNSALGSVVVDPLGLNVQATVLGVLDGGLSLPRSLPNLPASSRYRNGEGLVVQIPPLPPSFLPSELTIRIDFADGTRREFAAGITNRIVTTTYTVPPGSAIRHDLRSAGAGLYGDSFERFYVSSGGLITFLTPAAAATVSLTSFLAPSPIGPIPTVTPIWTDLGTVGLTVVVTEDPSTARVDATLQGGTWQSTGLPLGTATVGLNASGDVFFTTLELLTSSTSQVVIQGVTDQIGSSNIPNWQVGFASGVPDASLARSVSSSISAIRFAQTFDYGAPTAGLWTIM